MNKQSEMLKKKQGGPKAVEASTTTTSSMDVDIRSIMKDIESFVGSKHMTWKEKKELENRKVVSLGGKPVKKQRLPLSVARVMMKKQKEREQKMLQESAILGRFESRFSGDTKRSGGKRKPENRVLKSTAGTFRNGVLDVKHLLRPAASSRDSDGNSHGGSKGFKKKGGKKNKGKKGGSRKRH